MEQKFPLRRINFRITIGDLTRAIQAFRPLITKDMVRMWAEKGILPANRNPGSDRSWWYILPEGLMEALFQGLFLEESEVNGILQQLGLKTDQAQEPFHKKDDLL